MEEAPRKTKPEEDSSPAEDGSPLASEPKRQGISGEGEDGGGGGAGGVEEEEDKQWEARAAANATKYIAGFKAMEQSLKTSNEHLAKLKVKFGPDELHSEEFIRNWEKQISDYKKGNQDALNGLSELIEKWEMVLHGLSDEEPVNSSLPDDAEVDSPNNNQ